MDLRQRLTFLCINYKLNVAGKPVRGWSRLTLAPLTAGKTPAIFLELEQQMRELSIFVDESGDFGSYAEHSSYYIISLVMHDQKNEINQDIEKLEQRLSEIGYPHHCIHAGPIIRNENPYRKETLESRQKLLKAFMAFLRRINVSCKTIFIEKNHIENAVEATGKLAKILSQFIRENYAFFQGFDIVKIYYDNGQIEVSKLLSSVFNALLENVEFRKVYPSDYRLFQAADFIATMKLLEIKLEHKELSRAEEVFFKDHKSIRKNYIRVLEDKSVLD